MYNYLDLFSGIGGFAYGLHLSAMYNRKYIKNHFYSEIEKFCIDLYSMRFPDSINLGNIEKINFEKLKKNYHGEWIITGGFPCQDISIAGKGKGLIDEKTGEKTRSGLWFEFWRAIRDIRPKFAIMENVGAMAFRGLDTVLGSLAEIGYNAEWQDIRASDVGAPHKRERIWIVAYPESLGLQKNKIFSKKFDKSCTKKYKKWEIFLSITAGNYYLENWENVEDEICGDADGLPGKLDRLKGLGNAIVPQIAELLFNQIKEEL